MARSKRETKLKINPNKKKREWRSNLMKLKNQDYELNDEIKNKLKFDKRVGNQT
jgi:hypothetical protein